MCWCKINSECFGSEPRALFDFKDNADQSNTYVTVWNEYIYSLMHKIMTKFLINIRIFINYFAKKKLSFLNFCKINGSLGRLTNSIYHDLSSSQKKKLIKNSKKCNKSLRFLSFIFVIVMLVQAYLSNVIRVSAFCSWNR